MDRKVTKLRGRHLYYVLDEHGEAQPWEGGLVEWADRLQRPRVLAETHLESGACVITTFLGMDDAAATMRPAERPEVFGTLVRGSEEYFDATKADALARHARIVAKLRAGQSHDE